MLLLSEIYGCLFEDVIRTCMATSDPSIYAELCTFPERREEGGLYSLSVLT